MRATSILIVVFVAFFVNCKEDVDCTVPTSWDVNMDRVAVEQATIDQYLLDSAITTESHPSSGIKYVIQESGAGEVADMCKLVTKQYEITFLDGTPLISTLGSSFAERTALSNDIPAWQAGIPLVQDGGLITLYVPSPYAYGSSGRIFNVDGVNVTVPPNTILIFKISVIKVE